MVHRSVVGAPVAMETVEQERLISCAGIAESESVRVARTPPF